MMYFTETWLPENIRDHRSSPFVSFFLRSRAHVTQSNVFSILIDKGQLVAGTCLLVRGCCLGEYKPKCVRPLYRRGELRHNTILSLHWIARARPTIFLRFGGFSSRSCHLYQSSTVSWSCTLPPKQSG